MKSSLEFASLQLTLVGWVGNDVIGRIDFGRLGTVTASARSTCPPDEVENSLVLSAASMCVPPCPIRVSANIGYV